MELKLRSLPVSGTKSDLIERLRAHQELHRAGGGDSTASPTAGVSAGPAAGGARHKARQQPQAQKELYCLPRSLTGHRGEWRDKLCRSCVDFFVLSASRFAFSRPPRVQPKQSEVPNQRRPSFAFPSVPSLLTTCQMAEAQKSPAFAVTSWMTRWEFLVHVTSK